MKLYNQIILVKGNHCQRKVNVLQKNSRIFQRIHFGFTWFQAIPLIQYVEILNLKLKNEKKMTFQFFVTAVNKVRVQM